MKETFYFSHDYNARNDEKIKKLISKYWLEWYWIFWAIIEDLYNNANALRLDYDCIAFDLRMDVNIIKSIIEDFNLFIIEWDIFYSKSIKERLEQREEKSAKARESAYKRWWKDDANALQTQSECNAIKERKVKEIKEYKTKDDKTKEEVKEELQKFIEHWNKIFLEKREVTNKLEEKYLQIRKEYKKDDFKKWYNLYKDTKLKVKKEKWEFMFLLSPLAFLTNQVNWFISYL